MFILDYVHTELLNTIWYHKKKKKERNKGRMKEGNVPKPTEQLLWLPCSHVDHFFTTSATTAWGALMTKSVNPPNPKGRSIRPELRLQQIPVILEGQVGELQRTRIWLRITLRQRPHPTHVHAPLVIPFAVPGAAATEDRRSLTGPLGQGHSSSPFKPPVFGPKVESSQRATYVPNT